MKKFGFATIAATGFAAALVGLAAPAVAAAPAAPAALTSVEIPSDLSHHTWVNDIQQQQHQVRTPPQAIIGNGR